MTSFIIIILIIFSLLTRFAFVRCLIPSGRFREAIIWFFLWNSVLSWIYVEGFSAFDNIGRVSALLFWGSVTITELWLLAKSRENSPFIKLRTYTENRLRILFSDCTVKMLVISAAVIIVPLFALCILVPPNNFDSNSYHLHRILAWTHYKNVDFFPTPHIQQLYHNVLAEYLVLNVYLVTGTDRFVNLVQFFAGMGCITTLTLIARQLGIDGKGQAIGAFVLLTLPIGIFELTTTQVDYVASFFFTAFLYFGYNLKNEFKWTSLAGMSLSLSLAAFAKYPICFYAIPFCIYFGICFLRKYNIKRSIAILLVSFSCLAIVFLPFWKRNYDLFGNVISPTENSPFFSEKLPSDEHKVIYTISNIIKNSSLHLGLPHSEYNKSIESSIFKIHDLIGVDVDEPKISQDRFSIRYSVNEDMIPNTQHFVLILLFTIVLLLNKRNKQLKIFWILSLSGFFIFCTLLKFQLWSTRTHLPFFVMGSIMIGTMLRQSSRILQIGILLLLFIPALFFVFGNPAKPIVPLPYIVKRLTAHVPAIICLNSNEKEKYREILSDIYDFNPAQAECFSIKHLPDLGKRKQVFNALDHLGYYDPIKKDIFSIDRPDLYFMNDKEKLTYIKPIISKIEGSNPKIGVISTNGEGYYFYQKLLEEYKDVNTEFNYIFLKKNFPFSPIPKKSFVTNTFLLTI